jgi:imidazole glycerol-phosphate synthase subunit HisF
MLRPRIIPCLLIHQNGLVKTVKFKDPKYVGDPLNAVRIFNEKEVDELMVIDIDATAQGTAPDFERIKNLATECRMPLCYGGGVTTAEQARKIISLGAEKVAISAAAIKRPQLIREIADSVGTQSVVVVLDVQKRGWFNKYEVVTHNASEPTGLSPVDFACQAAELGAGEIVINSIDLDGTMEGYDLKLAKEIRAAITTPMSILGGAGDQQHIKTLIDEFGIIGAAAGSLFVFKGKYRAVLISYPNPEEKKQIAAAYYK